LPQVPCADDLIGEHNCQDDGAKPGSKAVPGWLPSGCPRPSRSSMLCSRPQPATTPATARTATP